MASCTIQEALTSSPRLPMCFLLAHSPRSWHAEVCSVFLCIQVRSRQVFKIAYLLQLWSKRKAHVWLKPGSAFRLPQVHQGLGLAYILHHRQARACLLQHIPAQVYRPLLHPHPAADEEASRLDEDSKAQLKPAEPIPSFYAARASRAE